MKSFYYLALCFVMFMFASVQKLRSQSCYCDPSGPVMFIGGGFPSCFNWFSVDIIRPNNGYTYLLQCI